MTTSTTDTAQTPDHVHDGDTVNLNNETVRIVWLVEAGNTWSSGAMCR